MRLRKNDCCCKGCTERHMNCHAECEKYKQYRSELAEIRNKWYMDEMNRATKRSNIHRMQKARKSKIGVD